MTFGLTVCFHENALWGLKETLDQVILKGSNPCCHHLTTGVNSARWLTQVEPHYPRGDDSHHAGTLFICSTIRTGMCIYFLLFWPPSFTTCDGSVGGWKWKVKKTHQEFLILTCFKCCIKWIRSGVGLFLAFYISHPRLFWPNITSS